MGLIFLRNRVSGVAPADAYAIGGNSPELVASFLTQEDGTTEGEYFRTGGATDDFTMFTFSRTNNATMFDSTGTLVYAPHNYLVNTDTLASASTYAGGTSRSGTATEVIEGVPLFTLDEGTDNNEHRITQSATLPSTGLQVGFSFCYKAGTCRYIRFASISGSQFDPGHVVVIDTTTHSYTTQDCTASITQVGSTDMRRVEVFPNSATLSTGVTLYLAMMNASGTSTVYLGTSRTVLVGGFEIWDATLPRANNPEQTVSGLEDFVLNSTASSLFLSRRNAYYHNGTSWVKGGLQKDPVANTQLLHGTDSFATQDETVTAQAYTLQFRGTGSIALTGAHTATLNGTGANDLVSLTFTPSAGTLTLTPSGTVDYPQLETGRAPTSYIPNTAGSGTVTRAIETLSIAGVDNPITATTATFFWDFLYTTNNTDPYAKPLEIVFTSNERMRIYDGDGANRGYVEWYNDPGLDYTDIYTGASGSFPGVNVRRRGCASIAENDELLISVNGSATGPTAVTDIADFSGQDIAIATSLASRQFTCFVREIRVGSFKTSGADAEAVTAL